MALALLGVGAATSGLIGQSPAAGAAPAPQPLYYLALGDSMAAGTGASTTTHRYVNVLYQHELSRFPTLQLVNLACGGATTTSMINGPGCSYASGSQLGDAEAFLRAHPKQVALVTMDIGANNVTPCVRPALDPVCAAGAVSTVGRDLARILRAVRAAAPGVEIVVLNYYDPFLAAWFLGPAGQALAAQSVLLLGVLNATIAADAGAVGGRVADVATAFATTDGTGGITVGAYYLPGMLAAGMLLSGVQNLAVDIAGEKSDGTLKRLGGTPLSPLSYFMGKIGEVLVTATIQAALLILVARFALGIDLPTEPGKWLTFAWVFLFGVITCAFLGIALSALPRSGKSATAVVIPIVLILQFISGVYLQFYVLPEWMQNVAGLFPLKWMAQGMRGVFLPESFAALEQSGTWDFPLVALNLGIWLAVGLVLSRVTFRWIRKDT